jgi:hypothetical protein
MKTIKTTTILCLTTFALLASGCSDKKEKKDGWNNPDVFKKEDPIKYKKSTRQIK